MNRLKPGLHCDISISTSMNISITNVHTCWISTRKVTYASVMSSRMKPWEYGTRHVFKISPAAFAVLQMPDTFLPTIFLSRLHLFLRLVNLHLGVGVGKLPINKPQKRVVHGDLWHGSRTEKIEDHGSRI